MENIYWFLLTTVLLIFLSIALYILVYQRLYLIESSSCPQIKGDFGVVPNKAGTVLSSCGDDSQQLCQSIAANLGDAINYCNMRSDICEMFTYDNYSGEVSIVNPTGNFTNSTNTNLFTRQVQFLKIS